MSQVLNMVEEQDIKIEGRDDRLIFTGNVTSVNPAAYMTPFLHKYHAQLLDSKVNDIVLDVTGLEFLNSTGIKSLVDWMLLLEKLPDHQRYKIKIAYSKEFLWQRATLETLVYLNPQLISLIEED